MLLKKERLEHSNTQLTHYKAQRHTSCTAYFQLATALWYWSQGMSGCAIVWIMISPQYRHSPPTSSSILACSQGEGRSHTLAHGETRRLTCLYLTSAPPPSSVIPHRPCLGLLCKVLQQLPVGKGEGSVECPNHTECTGPTDDPLVGGALPEGVCVCTPRECTSTCLPFKQVPQLSGSPCGRRGDRGTCRTPG